MSNRSRPLRVGVVGCGGFGRNAYVNNVVENPDASLVALCDVDLAQAEAAAREVFDDRGIKPRPALYTDYKEMIDQESLDVVMVGTMADVRPACSYLRVECRCSRSRCQADGTLLSRSRGNAPEGEGDGQDSDGRL